MENKTYAVEMYFIFRGTADRQYIIQAEDEDDAVQKAYDEINDEFSPETFDIDFDTIRVNEVIDEVFYNDEFDKIVGPYTK